MGTVDKDAIYSCVDKLITSHYTAKPTTSTSGPQRVRYAKTMQEYVKTKFIKQKLKLILIPTQEKSNLKCR